MSELLKKSRFGQWELLQKDGVCPCCHKKQCNCKPNCMLKNERDAAMANDLAEQDYLERVKAAKKQMKKNVNMSYNQAPNMAKKEMFKFNAGGQWSICGTGRDKPEDKMPETNKSETNEKANPPGKKFDSKTMDAPVKEKSMDNAKVEGKPYNGMDKAEQSKHDRCVEHVKGKVNNPHAVCVAAGVEPSKWKK